MADGNKQDKSEGKGCNDAKEEMDEDDEEMDFPFDLSEEWMVIDVDDEEEDEVQKSDSLSKDSGNEKDCASTSKSQVKDPKSHTAKPSDSKGQKESSEKPRDIKKKVSQDSSSIKNSASTRSTSQRCPKPISSQDKGNSKKDSNVPLKSPSDQSFSNKKDTSEKKIPKEDVKASKSNSMPAVDSSKDGNGAASNANTKEISGSTTSRLQTRQQTSKDRLEKINDKSNPSLKSSVPDTSASPTKTPLSQKSLKQADKNSSAMANNKNTRQTSKPSHPEASASSTKSPSSQVTPKAPVEASSAKTSNSNNQTPKSSNPKSSASSPKPSTGKTSNSTNQTPKSSTKPPSSQVPSKPSGKASSGNLGNSIIQTSMSAPSKTAQAERITSKNLSNAEKLQEGISQSQVAGNSKGNTSTKEKTTVSKPDNKSTSVKVTSTSTSSVCSVSVSASKAITTSETETKTLTKSSVTEPSSLTQSAVGVLGGAKKDVQKNNLKSPDSKKISAMDLAKQKSAKGQLKASRNYDSTGEIAAAMGAGDIGLYNIQVHDLDSTEKSAEKKTVQIKASQSPGLNPRKRPPQSNSENVVKKAKYEEKDSDVHSQARTFPNKKKEDIKGLKPDEKEVSVQKPSTKRIVRRFHRTTQTITKTTANQLVQCSLAHPPSGSSSKNQQVNFGIQCKIGGHFEDVMSRIISHITPVVDIINQEVFKAVLAFDASSIHRDIVTPGNYKYGLRLGQVTQSDVEKNFFKDNCIRKADGYNVCFWKKDCGIVDLLFYEQDTFVAVVNQIRKSRLESRYLCISLVKINTDEEKEADNSWDHFKATVVFDQNFVSTGYLSYYKTPIWSKPKVDEFVTMHNVPGGIPLSFLNLVIPDAITVLMRDVKAKCTRKGGGVRLGLSRKNGSKVFLKLFKQIFINNFPIVLTQGLSDKKDIPEVQALSKVLTELEKLERERQKEKICPRSKTAVPRDINDGKKRTSTEGTKSSLERISSPMNNPRRGMGKGQEAQHDIDSDLSDISELSFNENNLDNSRGDGKFSRAKHEPPQRKVEPKKSLKVTMGSKLLSRARNNLHQAQSRRQERSSGKKPVKSNEKRMSPNRYSNRTRAHSPRRLGAVSSRSNDMRRDDSRQRDEHHNRQNESFQNERSRNNRSREKGSIDRSSIGSGSRHGQRGHRDLNHNSARHDQSPLRQLRRPGSHNRSPEREVLVRGPNRMPRSQERHGVVERARMREGEGDNYMEFGHQSSSLGDSHERRISLKNPSEMMSDLERSSEDLRSVLDARKPRQVRMSPRRHGSVERIRFGSPGRQRRSRSQERRKRPLSRSPSPRYRKVMIGRRSLSPRNRGRRQQSGGPPQPSRPGMDVMAKDIIRSKTTDLRGVQAHKQLPGTGEPSKEESMKISKSLFVKLLTNALHNEGGEVDESTMQIAESFSPHRDDTGRMLSQLRSQESGTDERSFRNVDSFKKYPHIEQRRPDFEGDRSRYGQSGTNTVNFKQGSMSGGDVRPIPPPVLPPILTSTSSNFPLNKYDPHRSHEEGLSSSGPQLSQGVWAVPSSSSFTFPTSMPGNVRPPPIPERPSFPPPMRESMPPPQNLPPFNTQPPVMYPNTCPPFQPPRGPMPNAPHGIPPPRTAMWQNPRPGPF